MELLTEKTLISIAIPLSVGDAVRRIFETIAGGIILHSMFIICSFKLCLINGKLIKHLFRKCSFKRPLWKRERWCTFKHCWSGTWRHYFKRSARFTFNCVSSNLQNFEYWTHSRSASVRSNGCWSKTCTGNKWYGRWSVF